MSQYKEILKSLELIREAKQKEPVLNVITLFSGMGAPEIALDKLGVKYQVVIASDIDSEAAAVYKKLHGKKLYHGDDSFIPNVYDVAEQKKNFPEEIDLLIAGFPCFTAGTLVLTSTGLKPIEEVKVGDLVLTHKNRWKPVITVMQKQNAEIYKVTGRGFNEILTTSEHPFYALKTKKSKTAWIETAKLRTGYKVGSPLIKDIKSDVDVSTKTKALWILIGRFVGDSQWKIKPCFNEDTDSDYLIEAVCPAKEEASMGYLLTGAGIKFSLLKERSTLTYKIYDKELCEYLLKCGSNIKNKRVHPDLWLQPREIKEAFLGGYFASDTCKGRTREKVFSQRVTSDNLKLLYEIRLLVADIYKSSAIIFQSPKESGSYVLKFDINPKKSSSFEKDEVIWGSIRTVEKLDKVETVYNLEVADDNSYTANTIVVHNCQAFSTSGKQYGVYSRKVRPVNSSKTYVLNLKKHLTNVSDNFAVTVNGDKNDPLPEELPEGTEVEILPDSDGKLSFETLKVAQTFKPKVIILENVASFGGAVIDDEAVPSEFDNLGEATLIDPQTARRGFSGPARLNYGKDRQTKGGYLRALGNIFNKIGYSFYPMYLDPTSYTNSIVRRPRIYIIGIRNDIEAGINPNKLEYFDDKVASNFGLNAKKTEKERSEILEKSLDYIMSSKYSHGYMSHNPKELVKNLVAKFGYNEFAKATDYIFNKMVENGEVDPRSIKLNNFNYYNTEVIDREVASEPIQKFLDKIRNDTVPLLIDISDKSDTVDYLSDVIARGVSNYFEKSYGYYKTGELQGHLDLNISKKKPVAPSSKTPKSEPIVDKDPEQDELDLGKIVESIENNVGQVDEAAINKYKELIVKKLLVQFLITIYNKRSISYIPTILKSSTIPSKLGGTGNAKYFILRNKAGTFAWGYLHPAIIAKLMGMYTKNASGDDDVYQALASTKLANGDPISPNGIIRRIGNSMSVDVLEKLFKSLISMKAFK